MRYQNVVAELPGWLYTFTNLIYLFLFNIVFLFHSGRLRVYNVLSGLLLQQLQSHPNEVNYSTETDTYWRVFDTSLSHDSPGSAFKAARQSWQLLIHGFDSALCRFATSPTCRRWAMQSTSIPKSSTKSVTFKRLCAQIKYYNRIAFDDRPFISQWHWMSAAYNNKSTNPNKPW